MKVSESCASTPMNSIGRNNNFNVMRVVLASLVVLSHSSELIDGDSHREILTRIFGTITFGGLAVDGFFLLSGFLIVQSWERNPIFWDFIMKRVLRIYPGFIVASLVSAFIVGPLGANAAQYFAQINSRHFLKEVAMLSELTVPSTFEGTFYPYVNGSLWTIKYEFHCYIIVALLGLCGIFRWRQSWLILCGSMLTLSVFSDTISSFISRHAFPGLEFWIAYLRDFLRLVPIFLIGGCFYLFRDRVVYKGRWAAGAAVILFFCLFHEQTAELSLDTFGAYILFWFAFTPIPLLERFRTAPDISYGVYLYSWPTQKLLLWFIPSLSPWLLFVLALTLSCFCGLLSWYLVEKPFLRLKRKMA